jgi:hypothetical protein
MGEEMQLSKSHIGFGLEASRRTGRASPLPQAVQGAQAQPLSIGKDPGIKSEFGRMFSGLGSGLGSATPSRGSPMPQNGSFSHDSETGDMLRLQRVNSQQGRKPKRVKDEDVFDAENNDGRGTPLGVRGTKRNKLTGHHHYHAPHHQYVLMKLEIIICANEVVVIITITIITKNQTTTYLIRTPPLRSTDGRTIFLRTAQANQCTTITISKVHHIIIITTIIMHLGVFHQPLSSRPRCRSRFMTFSPSWSKLPSSPVGI